MRRSGLLLTFALLACFSAAAYGEETTASDSPVNAVTEPSCQQLAQYGEPGDIEPVACAGDCEGSHWGFATSGTACDKLTEKQKKDLLEAACNNTDKPTARRRANDDCLKRDNSGTCLCTGGAFTEHPGATTPWGSGCIAACQVKYKGTCNAVAAPVPTPT